MEERENHSAAKGWPSSATMETDTGLEAEAPSNSGNACVSRQAGPSPDLASWSPPFLHTPLCLLAQQHPAGRGEAGNPWRQTRYTHLKNDTYDLRRLQSRETGEKEGGATENDAQHCHTMVPKVAKTLSFLPLRSGKGKDEVIVPDLQFYRWFSRNTGSL